MITNNGKAFAESKVTPHSYTMSGSKVFFYEIERKTNVVSVDGSSVAPNRYNATSNVSDSAAFGYATMCMTNLIFGKSYSYLYPANSGTTTSYMSAFYSFGYQSEDISEETYSIDTSYTISLSGININTAYGDVIFSITNLDTVPKTINTFGIHTYIDHSFIGDAGVDPKSETKKYFLLYAEKFDDVTIQPGETYQFTLKRNLE